MLREVVYVVVDQLQPLVGDGHGRCRSVDDLALHHIVYGCVLHHFAEHVDARDKRRCCQCLEHGVARGSHTALNGQELARYASCAHIASQQLGHVLAYLRGGFVGFVEATSLLGDVALHHAGYLPCVDGYEVVAHAVVGRQHRNGLASEAALRGLERVVKQARVGAVEAVALDDDALGEPHYGGGDASGRGQVSLADVLSLDHVAHFDDGPVYFAVEVAPQPLGHVAQMHVLILYLAQVGVLAEVLVGAEGRAEAQCPRRSHVAFDALAGGSAGEYAHAELLSTVVEQPGTLRKFPESGLRASTGSEARKSKSVFVVDHCRSFGGSYP